jgi:DNA polymerase-3 subunit delta'
MAGGRKRSADAGAGRKPPAARKGGKGGAARKGAAGGRRKAAAEPEVSAPAAPLLRLGEVMGNARPRRLLAGALAEGRLFPALLLHGPAGIGKLTTARAVAAALNCASPRDGDACLSCPSCRKIASWTHPDVKVLESEADAVRAGRPLFFPDPAAASRGGSRSGERLLIGQVRRLIRETEFRPFEGRRRVLLVRHLESDPTMGCANALLKVLEEPPEGTSFILTSARPDRLPDTIRSRCQSLAFMPLARQEAAAFLEARGVPAAEAELRAALSGGRPGAALALDTEGGLARRDAILAALAAASGDAMEAVAAADDLQPAAAEMPDLLALLALVVRDLMVLPDDAGGELVVNRDRRPDLERLAAAVPPARAARVLERIAWCERALERSVSPGLMLQTLLLEAGGHLPPAPLTAPWLDDEAPVP